ncbi:MFS transporter [Nocardia sp. NPDC003482]
MTSVAPRVGPARTAALVAVVTAVALNLRPAITTVGPELDSITGDFGAGAAAGGVITALPVFAFALVSLAAPALLARVSVRAGLYGGLTLLGVSVALRPWGGLVLFVLGTFLAALGVGLLAVLLPVVIRATGRTGLLVTTFTTALQAGAAIGFAAVVPLSRAFGGWQWAVAVWAVLAPAAILALLWGPTLPVPDRGPSAARHPLATLRRTETVGLAVFFGLQALVAFVVIGWLPTILADAGVGKQAAGAYLAVLTCLGVPISLVVSPLVARSARPSRWLAGFSACTVLGVLAFLVAPAAAPLPWSLILGVGLAVFSPALAVVTVRAAAHEAIGVSSAVQGVGYVIAALGPFAVGLFRELSAGWTLPLAVLLAIAVAQLVVGLTRTDPVSPQDERRDHVG